MKVKDYKAPLGNVNYTHISIRADYKGEGIRTISLWLDDALKKYPDAELPEEEKRKLDLASIESFLQEINKRDKEETLKEHIYFLCKENPGTEKIILLALEHYHYTIPNWKAGVIKDVIKKMYPSVIPSTLHPSRYAIKHYPNIKKYLSETGTVAGAVRMFNNKLTLKEHAAVSKKISRMLKDDGIKYPYRDTV